jgi:hypothetical protein
MENVGIFIAILECLRAIWCILWPFGIFMAIWYFYGHLVFLWPFGIFMAIWYFYGHLEYFTVILYILWPFGIFCGHLVHFVVIWCIFSILVCFTKNALAYYCTGVN